MIGNEETVIHPKAAEILEFFEELKEEIVKVDLSLGLQCIFRPGNDESYSMSNIGNWSDVRENKYRYLRVIFGQAEFFMSANIIDGTAWGHLTLRNGRQTRIANRSKHPGKLDPKKLLKILYRANHDSPRTIETYYQNWLLGLPVEVIDPSNYRGFD